MVFIKDLKSCYQYLQQLTVVSVVSITPILLRAEYNNCVTRISMRTDGKGKGKTETFVPDKFRKQKAFTLQQLPIGIFSVVSNGLIGDCRGQFEELTMCQDGNETI